jgi:hypothetical protein
MSRSVLPLAALVALASALPATASQGAHAAASCHLSASEQRHLGATYVTSLSVRHTSCASGKAVVRAFHACARRHGVRGRCTSPVLGYHCSEKRSGIPTQFTGKVTCTRGRASVVHTYTQFI